MPLYAFSPFYLMYGREAREPSDMMPPARLRTVTDENMIYSQMWHDAISFVRDKIKEEQEKQKFYYDKSTKLIKFKENDRILLKEMANVPGKFNMRWEGPYVILEKKSDVTYKIQREDDKKIVVAHVDRMKKLHAQRSPNQPFLQTLHLSLPLILRHKANQSEKRNQKLQNQKQ